MLVKTLVWSIILLPLNYSQGCEKEVLEVGNDKGELKNECVMRFSWALVHSRRADDVQRGIAMLEGETVCLSSFHFISLRLRSSAEYRF